MNFFRSDIFVKALNFLTIFFSLILYNLSNNIPEKNANFIKLYNSVVRSGKMHREKGNFHYAIDAFRQALSLTRNMNDREREVKCLASLGLLYWDSGRLQESSEKYHQALDLAKKINMKNEQEECRNALRIHRQYNEGKKYRSTYNYSKSIESFQRAIYLSRKTDSKEHELKCLRQLSLTYCAMDQLQEFFTMNNEALKIAQSLNHRREKSKCLINIGIYNRKTGNYSKAITCHEKALKIARDIKERRIKSACLTNIGNIYENIGNYDKALDYLEKAFIIDQKLGDDTYISMDLNNLGITYRKKGLISGKKEDFYKALDCYKKCLKLTKKTRDRKTEIQALNNMGNVHSDLENYQKALNYFQSGYKKAEEIQNMEALGMILVNLGIVHFKQRDYDGALRSYQKSIKLANRISCGHILWEAYFGLGKCHEMGGKLPQAIMCYEEAIDIIDNIRNQIYLDTHKAGFAKSKLKTYESLINLLYRINRDEFTSSLAHKIFHFVERAKARAFLENLRESRVNIKESLNPELKKREKELSSSISLIIVELSKPCLPDERRKELLEEIKQEEDRYIRLISRMKMEDPNVAALVSPSPCHVDQVQEQLLDKKTVLIEYFLGESQSFVFLITKNGFYLHPLPYRERIEKSVKAYLKILSTPKKGIFKGVLAAKRIYNELIFPVEKNIPESAESLIIIPDGVLYYLPFETLIPCGQNQFSEDIYLIENYNISYAPSSSALLFLLERKLRKVSPKNLLAFGNPIYALEVSPNKRTDNTYIKLLKELYSNQGFDLAPLPSSGREVSKISKYFSEKRRDIYLREKAKEETVKRISLENYQIIHFACHGFIDEEFPYRSALVLSLDDKQREDGFLQVREIYNLQLRADLIVLSACQTGRGKLEYVEGVLGLPRVFFYTGAKSVVSTLWMINDDSTAMFMDSFYRNLFKGSNKAQALRLAKLKMINSKLNHPFYWAAFILNGDYKSKLNFK